MTSPLLVLPACASMAVGTEFSTQIIKGRIRMTRIQVATYSALTVGPSSQFNLKKVRKHSFHPPILRTCHPQPCISASRCHITPISLSTSICFLFDRLEDVSYKYLCCSLSVIHYRTPRGHATPFTGFPTGEISIML
jgi:hypothetical protein